ncbi:MAG: CotH kinase family protein [Crocinitomicaceae bacterium]
MRPNLLLRTSLVLSFLFLQNNWSSAQNLFAIDTIRTIEIEFYDSNWDHILDSLAQLGVGTGTGSERILADVTIDGVPFDSCGVRYKGNSSMDTASNKNPFNIDLNWTVVGQKYMGKNKLKLANQFTDPSMIREALSYEIANKYMDAPRASFVKLFINGDYRGIYTNTESIDNEFLDDHYNSSENPFFKCDPINFDLAVGNSNLSYHADTIAYDTLYQRKSLYGNEELQTLCYVLSNNINDIEQYLDVDRALWFLALSSALVHNDGYTTFQHNYYLYKMDNDRWSITIWDLNMSFGGLLWNGTNLLPLGLGALQTQDPYLHELDLSLRPLIAQLLSIPEYRKMYTAHYKTIMQENISNGDYLLRGQVMQNLIDADMQNEPYNAYTYNEFADNLNSDVGFWFNYRPGIENLMNTRNSHINSLPEFQAAQPIISNVSTSSNQPPVYSSVDFTAEVANAQSVFLGYRSSHFDVFTKLEMFDDGMSNDGAAGDGVYGTTISIGATDVEYYFYALNTEAAKFSPLRAQYEFYTLSPEKGLVINELDAININNALDQSFEFDDWIELYNNTGNSISLDGYHLSDELNNPNKWAFPDTTIGPGEYLIIWADLDITQTGLHANFALDQSGESIYLTDNFGYLVDEVTFPLQEDYTTWGRFVNGTGNFQKMFPSFDAENTTPLDIEELPSLDVRVYPNPTSGKTTVLFSESVSSTVQLVNLMGQVVLSDELVGANEFTFDASEFDGGIYFLSSGGTATKVIVK